MLYQKLIENILLPAGDLLLDTNYISSLKKWRKITKLSKAELEAMQNTNLTNILVHATQNIPYYRNLKILGANNPVEWLKQFPVMYKHTIKENLNDMIYGDKNKLHIEKSSGSSGIQGAVYVDKKEASSALSIQILWWEWAGYRFGNSILQTGITPNRGIVKSIKDYFLRTDYLPAFGISEEQVLKKLKELQKSPKDHFAGYASSLYVFAEVAKKYNIKDVKFKSVFSWGDKMFPHYRALIQSQFSTKVFDSYGCTEGFMMGAQNDKETYYLMSPHVYIEFLDKDGNDVKPGEFGYVVVTRLDAYAMPLIRYYLGDLAIKGEVIPGVKYEMAFPLIDKIIGRDTDIVRTASGKYMVVHSFTGIFEHLPEVKQFRVIQRDMQSIEIEVIPGEEFSENVFGTIKSKIHAALNEPFPVNFTIVDNIPSTPSGKPQIIQSFIKE